jgi:hypothetical protein
MSDRAVQDEVIRYLADAKVRTQKPHWPICAGEAPKASRFAHFLARRYYRDRLARSFGYSYRLRGQTGRIAEEVVDTGQFDLFLNECALGSLGSARWVGRIARSHLSAASEPGPWWRDLLDYEYAYFLQAATAERGASTDHPSPGVSAVCRQFAWALPEMLPRLRSGGAITNELRIEVTLMFSRTHTGRIYVVEIDATMERIFRAADGTRSREEIASWAGTRLQSTHRALEALAAIGAIQLPA